MPSLIWQTSRFEIDLSAPKLMAIVNLTPDSFSDGGSFASTAQVLAHCEQAIQEGAHILDLGAESTRPGAQPVSEAEEWARLQPVLREAVQLGVPISIDTYKPAIMRAALDGGADIINDIWGFRRLDQTGSALNAVAAHPRCGVIVMHMLGEPQTMQAGLDQAQPQGQDIVQTVLDFLQTQTMALQASGVQASRIAWDVGIGFGKTVMQNFELLDRQAHFLPQLYPSVCAWSRKSSLGAVTQTDQAADRVVASVAAMLLAVERGARVLRVHDVKASRQAVQVWQTLQANPTLTSTPGANPQVSTLTST
jgi:dihydropteroate synthase